MLSPTGEIRDKLCPLLPNNYTFPLLRDKLFFWITIFKILWNTDLSLISQHHLPRHNLILKATHQFLAAAAEEVRMFLNKQDVVQSGYRSKNLLHNKIINCIVVFRMKMSSQNAFNSAPDRGTYASGTLVSSSMVRMYFMQNWNELNRNL